MTQRRVTPLHERHKQAGASFTGFGGYDMPLRYGSETAEHRAVREAAGLFDISHMGEIRVDGPQAPEFLDYALAGRLSAVDEGRAKYTLLLNSEGGIMDDLIVYRLAPDSYLVIANASNQERDAEALTARAQGFTVTINDVSADYALLALQGPASKQILAACPQIDVVGLDELKYYAWTTGTFDGTELFIARTGYTGENGYEILVPTGEAEPLWDTLLSSGAEAGLVPAGLAARDSLRLEAGMPLYGHELTDETLPSQASLGKVVVSDKDNFVGKQALEHEPDDLLVLVGLEAEGRRPLRAGYAVVAEGKQIGKITSGALSPTLGHPIAMAYVAPRFSELGTELAVDVRGKEMPVRVTALKFYRRQS